MTRVWVVGELSNLARPASGHLYFTLKDESAQIRCAWFLQRQRGPTIGQRSGFKDGDRMLAFGRVSIYEARGDYQLIVEQLEPAGEGALRRQFEVLKKKLAAEGLFDASRKKALPALPGRIGVITSPSGAALHDILSVLRRRFPAIPVVIYPSAVQGESAAAELRGALAAAVRRKECDVLIIGRGGGSLEDLWSFNDEALARDIAACPIPVVSAVGHDVDFTIWQFGYLYNFEGSENLVPFVGGGLGSVNTDVEDFDDEDDSVFFVNGGARWFFNETFGLRFEGGLESVDADPDRLNNLYVGAGVSFSLGG